MLIYEVMIYRTNLSKEAKEWQRARRCGQQTLIGIHHLMASAAILQNTVDMMQALRAMVKEGIPVNPADIYFRCQPKLEAAGEKWAWLGESQFIGSGRRAPDGVFLSFYRVR